MVFCFQPVRRNFVECIGTRPKCHPHGSEHLHFNRCRFFVACRLLRMTAPISFSCQPVKAATLPASAEPPRSAVDPARPLRSARLGSEVPSPVPSATPFALRLLSIASRSTFILTRGIPRYSPSIAPSPVFNTSAPARAFPPGRRRTSRMYSVKGSGRISADRLFHQSLHQIRDPGPDPSKRAELHGPEKRHSKIECLSFAKTIVGDRRAPGLSSGRRRSPVEPVVVRHIFQRETA